MKKVQYGDSSRNEFIEISPYVGMRLLKCGEETQQKERK
jgi:hypothetical protein